MKIRIDKPYHNELHKSMFSFHPGMMKAKNYFFPGMPVEFIQCKNSKPVDRIPQVLV